MIMDKNIKNALKSGKFHVKLGNLYTETDAYGNVSWKIQQSLVPKKICEKIICTTQ